MHLTETLQVNEIFFSIQGESSHAGKPCVFIRLTGCNLRCSYCDTPYAFEEGQTMAIDMVFKTIAAYSCKTICVTGGEPLLQKGTIPFLRQLCEMGYHVLLETNGSLPIEQLDNRIIRIVDMKCPASAMEDRNHYTILNMLQTQDELKFVISDRNDFEWSLNLLRSFSHLNTITAILFSPVYNRLPPSRLAEWIKDSAIALSFPNVRLQLAIHKYIWPNQPRGV